MLFTSIAAPGDDTAQAVQEFAARYLAFLIIKAIGTLTVMTTSPEVFANALMDADDSTVNFEGHPGGAWHKVIRWSFEQQGLYQPPRRAHARRAGRGASRCRRLYRRRTRGRVRAVPTTSRRRPTFGTAGCPTSTAHEQPLADFPSYVYVRIRNRGTQAATDVAVKLFEAEPAS